MTRRTRRSNSDELIEARAEIARLKDEVQSMRESAAASEALMKMVADTVIELRDKLRNSLSGPQTRLDPPHS